MFLNSVSNHEKPPSDEKVLKSAWWKIFQQRLANLRLVRDIGKTLPGPLANLNPVIEIIDSKVEISEENRFLRFNPYQNKSWVIGQLVEKLGGAEALLEFKGMTVGKNNLVITAVGEGFYGRFAVEIAEWAQELSIEDRFEDEIFIRCVQGLVHTVFGYAIRAQRIPENLGSEIDFDSRALGSYSFKEKREALEMLGLDFHSLKAIDFKYEPWRLKIIAESHYREILAGDFDSNPDSKISELARGLDKANLNLSDIGGSRKELAIACSKFLDQRKRRVIGTIKNESRFS